MLLWSSFAVFPNIPTKIGRKCSISRFSKSICAFYDPVDCYPWPMNGSAGDYEVPNQSVVLYCEFLFIRLFCHVVQPWELPAS
jgi:hypothetical protein